LNKKNLFLANPTTQAVGRIAASALLLFGLGVAIPKPAHAIFGIGDVVFDPSSWGELVNSDLTLTQQLAQAMKIATNGIQTYQLAMNMAVALTHAKKSDFITLAQLAVADHVSDLNVKGESAGWSTSVNGSNPSGAPAAWTAASLGLKDMSIMMAPETVGTSAKLAQLASVNALTGSSVKCMETISTYRGNSLANAAGPLLKTAMAHLDGTPANNTAIAQSNISNAQLNQLMTETRAQGDLHSCMVEQMLVASKTQSDQITHQLNLERDFQADVAANAATPTNTSVSFGRLIP
jgi:hypothetical protein